MTSPSETFVHKYATTQQRLVELMQWAEDPSISDSLPPTLLGDLGKALEEMHVAAEMMHEQTERLAEAQQAVERERRYYQELFDLAPDGYLVTDQFGTIRRANQAAAELFSCRPAYLTGKPLIVLILEEDRSAFRTWFTRTSQRGGRDEWEGRMRNRAGGSFPAMLSITTSRLPSGHIDHFRWLVRDLTERKRMEAELRQRAEQFESANQAKDEFLAMLGHELRNPLVPLRNLAPILAKDCSPERLDWAMGVLRRQVANLTRLVDDLLDASRLNRGKMQVRLTPLDLVSVLRAAVADQRKVLTDGGLSLEIELPDAPVRVRGDATRVSQVMDNLLHNAAKFTPPGGRVSVRLSVENGQAVVSVRDTGRGIAPELLPHLFDAFVQGKGHLGGLGLGLTLVKGLVELHGGAVSVESEGPGQGTAFTLYLPLTDATVPELPTRAAGPRRACRILVIDDNHDVAETLRCGLEKFGHRVEAAYSGKEGIESILRASPDVVLCDLGMPEMSGYEVAQALRREPFHRRLPLIAYSGFGQEDIRRRAMEAGFDLCLVKPLDLEQLQANLTDLASRRA